MTDMIYVQCNDDMILCDACMQIIELVAAYLIKSN